MNGLCLRLTVRPFTTKRPLCQSGAFSKVQRECLKNPQMVQISQFSISVSKDRQAADAVMVKAYEDEFMEVQLTAEEKMEKALEVVQNKLTSIRAGRANPTMLDTVQVDYYGVSTQLKQMASVSAPDNETIMVQPFEKTFVDQVETAITKANLGFNTAKDGARIRINIPMLTAERRKELTKQAKAMVEQGKVSVRNVRKDAKQKLDKVEGCSEDITKDQEDALQQLTDKFVKKMDEVYENKEKELKTI